MKASAATIRTARLRAAILGAGDRANDVGVEQARLASAAGPAGAKPLDGFGAAAKQIDCHGFKLCTKPVRCASNDPITGVANLGEPIGEEPKRGHPPEIECERPPVAHCRRAGLVEHIDTRRPRTTPGLAARVRSKQDKPTFAPGHQRDVPDMTGPRPGRVLPFWVSGPNKIARLIGRSGQSWLAA